jgi:hypothetical protein
MVTNKDNKFKKFFILIPDVFEQPHQQQGLRPQDPGRNQVSISLNFFCTIFHMNNNNNNELEHFALWLVS